MIMVSEEVGKKFLLDIDFQYPKSFQEDDQRTTRLLNLTTKEEGQPKRDASSWGSLSLLKKEWRLVTLIASPLLFQVLELI